MQHLLGATVIKVDRNVIYFEKELPRKGFDVIGFNTTANIWASCYVASSAYSQVSKEVWINKVSQALKQGLKVV